MSDLRKTAVALVYTVADGTDRNLGSGTIDETGIIRVDQPAPGEENFVTKIVADLNGRDHVIVREPPATGGRGAGIQKRRVTRDEDDFLGALVAYAARLYNLRLDFDAAGISPEPAEANEPEVDEDLGDGRDPDDIPETGDDVSGDVSTDAVEI